jgi:hypothetical protein
MQIGAQMKALARSLAALAMRLNIHKLLVNVLNEPAFCKQVIPRGLDNF